MKELSRIIHQFENSFNGKPTAWYGSPLLSTIEELTAEKALKRPITEAHNIWELVNHITVWKNEAIKSLKGDLFPFLPDDKEWPPILDNSEKAWKDTIEKLKMTHKEYMETISSFDPDKFDTRINISEPWFSPWLSRLFSDSLCA